MPRDTDKHHDGVDIAGAREKIDLGPLVGPGNERGFRTREKVPMSGGMSGVEMVTSSEEEAGPSGVGGSSIREGASWCVLGMVMVLIWFHRSYIY